MKLLFTLLFILTSTFSWAVYSPNSINVADSCEVLVLTTGEKLLVQVNRVENDYIYFHLCGEMDYPERKLQMKFVESWDKSESAVSKIRKQNAEDAAKFSTMGEIQYCENLLFTNETELLVHVVKVDSVYMYYRPCDKPNSAERTVKLSFIKKRVKTNSTALSIAKQKRIANEMAKKNKPDISNSAFLSGLGGFLAGLIIPPTISIFFETLFVYLIVNLLFAGLTSLILASFQQLRKRRSNVVLMVFIGTFVGAILLPILLLLILF